MSQEPTTDENSEVKTDEKSEVKTDESSEVKTDESSEVKTDESNTAAAETAPKKKSGAPIAIILGLVAIVFFGIPCAGIVAAIAIPNFVSQQYKSKRAEVPANIKGIKTALIAYESNFDVFVSASAYPSMPTKTTQQWVKANSGGFATLGWSPDGDVRGSYSITTTASDFTVIGISDVDGDGTYATYMATKSTNPTAPITGPDVY